MKIRIIRRLLPVKFAKNQRMSTNPRMDYLGQILYQWGHDPGSARLPSELGLLIPYLTTELRGRIIDTALTISIVKLDTHPRDEQERKLSQLFSEVGIEVIYE